MSFTARLLVCLRCIASLAFLLLEAPKTEGFPSSLCLLTGFLNSILPLLSPLSASVAVVDVAETRLEGADKNNKNNLKVQLVNYSQGY